MRFRKRSVKLYVYQSRSQVTAGRNNSNVQTIGVTPAYASVHKITVSSGVFLSDSELNSLARVAVLGPQTATDLFGDGVNPVGQQIRIRGISMKVIGVTTTKGGSGFLNQVEQHAKKLNLKNLELTSGPMSSEKYDEFLESLDCMVFVSKGEGYSITPREMLALGKPVILSNNTAHRTICKTGFVKQIESNIKQPAKYEIFQNQQIGYYFDCEKKNIIDAMREIYYDYPAALDRAKPGREWVKNVLWNNLKPLYKTLVKPKRVMLTKSNYVSDEILGTTSQNLVKKYERFAL
jgi:glycosyltransferase involved in cell wall biosynthesis